MIFQTIETLMLCLSWRKAVVTELGGVFVLMQAQDACGQLEIDNALVMVRDLEKDIQEAKASAREGKLKPLPGETVKRVRSYRPPNPQI